MLKFRIMNTHTNALPKEVFSGSIWEAELVKSLLEDAAIGVYLKDEITGTLVPWYTAGGGAGAVKVMVPDTFFERASLIIAEYEKNIHRQN